MGITIAYRGRLADLSRIEDFEDRLLDLALEVGGLGRIWRSYAHQDPKRVIRGVILNLAPGLESTSMLVSPEGWLIGLADIEDAELGRLKEPPWCFTKTQFGPLQGHVVLVEMLTALKREFLPDLEVSDEGGYWETRNLDELARRHSFLKEAIDLTAEGLQRHGLTPEAAESPDILLKRVERVAAQVERVLRRPAEHPPVSFPDDDFSGTPPDLEATEALWDEMFKHNRRQQERLQRALEERRSRGEDDDQAFEKALEDLAITVPGEDDSNEPWSEDESTFSPEPFDPEAGPEESLTEEDDPFSAEKERHPLLQHAMDLLHSLHTVFRDTDPRFASALQTLLHGAGDAMGGLAQAMADEDDDFDSYGLRITQLKRSLRGLAFAQRALFLLRDATAAKTWKGIYDAVTQLNTAVFAELSRLRSEYRSQTNEE